MSAKVGKKKLFFYNALTPKIIKLLKMPTLQSMSAIVGGRGPTNKKWLVYAFLISARPSLWCKLLFSFKNSCCSVVCCGHATVAQIENCLPKVVTNHEQLKIYIKTADRIIPTYLLQRPGLWHNTLRRCSAVKHKSRSVEKIKMICFLADLTEPRCF